MKSINKLILFLSFIIFIFSFNFSIVKADTTYEIKNNGLEMSADDIYKDSGLPSSFVGAEYYDVAMPYNLTAYDVGGWCSDAANKGYVLSESKLKKIKISANTCYEFGYDSSLSHVKSSWGTVSKDSNTGCTVVEKNGVKFFIMAVQKYQYNNSNAKSWFGGFSSESNGGLIDVILTDGTVIHFIKGDSNAAQHTNGGETGKGQNKATDSNSNYKGQWWTFEPVKIQQYANIYGLSECNSIEIWGSSSKFSSYYNMGSGDDQNRIAYYRIYNLKASDSFTPASEGVKPVSYSLGNVKLANGTTTSMSDGITFEQTGRFMESEYVNVANLTEIELNMPDIGSLNEEELMGVKDWKNNVEYSKENAIIRFMRKTVVIFGILLIIWTIFLYLAYWFDRVNNFVEVSLLEKVSFGRLMIAPDEDEATFDPRGKKNGEIQTVNHRHMVGICLTSIFFAVLIISGKIYDLLGYFIRFIMNILGI